MPVNDPTRQAYLSRLRTKEGIRDFGTSYFQKAGNDPFRNQFAQTALTRGENELPLLTDMYQVKDDDLEAKLGQYFSGAWNPSGRDVLAERDRLGGLEGSIFATGNAENDQAMWQGATLLGHADQGNNWANAYGTIEKRRAGEFNSMLASKAASNSPWEGFFSAWRQGMPNLTGTMDPSQPGGGGPVPPGTPNGLPPVNPNLTTFPSAPGKPWEPLQPGAKPPAAQPLPLAPFSVTAANGVATLSGGTPDQVRGWIAKNRSPTGHPDAPGVSSFRIGPYLYTAPRDVVRKFTDANGNGRYMGSGYNKLLERSDLLLQQGQAKNWYEAMTKAIDWIMSKGSGFGFSRVA